MLWVVVLLAVGGLALIISEVFVPGGVLGTLGGAALVGCVVLAVMHFSTAAIIATVFLVPAAGIVTWIVAFRLLSRSRLGSNVFLRTTQKGMSVLSGSAEQLTRLIGKRGVALSYLRPAGVADIEGERVDVVTESEYVPAGTPIVVIELEGNHLVVRAAPDHGEQATTT